MGCLSVFVDKRLIKTPERMETEEPNFESFQENI